MAKHGIVVLAKDLKSRNLRIFVQLLPFGLQVIEESDRLLVAILKLPLARQLLVQALPRIDVVPMVD